MSYLLGPLFRNMLMATLLACMVLVLLPILVVVGASFGATAIPMFPPSGLSLRWYGEAMTKSVFQEAARNSLWLAVLATVINVPIALAAAHGVLRVRQSLRPLIEALLLAPLMTPAFVISLAILVATSDLAVDEPIIRLLLGHVVITFPYLLRTIMVGLQQINADVIEAARTLGASRARVLLHVTIPSIAPGLAAGMLFAFLISFDNVSISLFLSNTRTNTLPVAILSYVEYNFDPSLMAVSTMLVALSLAVVLVMERVAGVRRVLAR